MDTTQTEPLTDEMITALMSESAAAGDSATSVYCLAALANDEKAQAAVAGIISDARAMDESQPFVKVVS